MKLPQLLTLLPILAAWTSTTATAAPTLQASASGRYLQWSDGTPFYVFADTAWGLARDYSREEVIEYLDLTRAQKFNTVQISAVHHAVFPGTKDADMLALAFEDSDVSKPKADYWKNVDWVVEQATQRGFVVTINPLWRKQLTTEIQAFGPEKLRAYAKWFASRFRNNPRVIYFVGGDEQPEPVRAEIVAIAEGIQEVYGGKAIVAYHSLADTSSCEMFPEKPAWLTLNWTYAYGPKYRKLQPYEHNLSNAEKFPGIPTQFGEGYYEFGVKKLTGKAVTGRWAGRYAARRQAWWASFLTGGSGQACGMEAIWRHDRDGETWKQELAFPGRGDMTQLASFVEKIPWWTFQPDAAHKWLTGGFGNWRQDDYAVAAVTADKKLAVLYTPIRTALELNLDQLAGGKLQAEWFDPTTGEFQPVKDFPSARGTVKIQTPEKNSSGEDDFVLLVKVKTP